MKVVHITPTYFDNSSIIGGGERYPTELATNMAEIANTTLLSFSSERNSYSQGSLKIEVYPVKNFIKGSKIDPVSFQYLRSILNADVVHIHHLSTLVSELGASLAAVLGKRVFVTDYGGGSGFVRKLNNYVPMFWCYRKAIAYSRFGLDFFPKELQEKAVLIKGGIDTNRFCPDASVKKEKTILYVGRILPHKGINYLIEGFKLLNQPDLKLKILGRVYSEQFYQDLKQQAEGLAVEFIHDADDGQLLQEYQKALATVLPSVHTTCYGQYTPVPELMGFTLLESQACGTPVICTDAGAMHEFVDNGKTGFVVKQNSGEAIAVAMQEILSLSPPVYQQHQALCRKWIEPLNWSAVVQRHLKVYGIDRPRAV